ncbi:MAG TPA: aldehyde dehydrogenase family protein [Dehalococcoidia bacterium]|jgi:acyl-CoA reductase-like NAD-dependent aldehyde dehydrogenase
MRDATTDDQLSTLPTIGKTVERAVAAQAAFEPWAEPRVDDLLYAIAECIAEHAEALAATTVAETGLGNVADKTLKNLVASRTIQRGLAGKPGTGLLRVDARRNVAEVASPVGVVFGLVPQTNPVATFVFKVLIALKARNALILSCHRGAQGVCDQTGELIAAVLRRHRAPRGLVQWLRDRTDRETTLQFMRHPAVALILATGGAGMVRAAYSSGTPAIGVGPGNAPAWVCADSDPDAAARCVVASKSFDNGIICASEHNLVVDSAVRGRFVAALQQHGAALVGTDDVPRVLDALFDLDAGRLRPEAVGQPAARLAQLAGLRLPDTTRLVVVPAEPAQLQGPLGREKLAPVVSLFTVADEEEGFAVCRQILSNDGRGHTAIIHSADEARIRRFGLEMPASRILVNVPGVQGTLGIGTGLQPSMTLGCGTFGGTSTTDGVTYTHLSNIKRIAYGATLSGDGAEKAA